MPNEKPENGDGAGAAAAGLGGCPSDVDLGAPNAVEPNGDGYALEEPKENEGAGVGKPEDADGPLGAGNWSV